MAEKSVRITNIVATASLGCALDLKHLEQQIPLSQYLPHRFSGLLIRILQPYKAHCQVYQNGKITINGARSVRAARALSRRFCEMIRDTGYSAELSAFKIVNIVACCKLSTSIAIEQVYPRLLSDFPHTIFNPELFPGMSVKMSNCTAILFRSGKINFLGCSILLDAEAAKLDLSLYL